MDTQASIAALQAALKKQQGRLAELKSARAALVAGIARVDKQVAKLTGKQVAAPAAKPAKAAQPAVRREGQTLGQVIAKILAGSGEPLGITEITRRVLAAGYKTRSGNFTNVVSQYIYTSKSIRRVRRGKYSLKKTA